MNKKTVLLSALVSLVLVIVANPIFPEILGLPVLFVSSILLFFSLVTYKMKEEIFRSWWNFAYGWVVAIVAATFILAFMGGGGGGWGISSGIGDFVVFVILYFFLIVGSISKIIYTFSTLKTNKAKSEKIYGLVYGVTAIVTVSFLVWFFKDFF